MSKKILVLTAVILSVLFVSCKKESSQPSGGDITGTWNFVSMEVSSTTTQEYTDEFGSSKTISTSDYTTENNQGTITIDAAKMTSTNLSYSVHTDVQAKYYLNGSLVSSFSSPVDYDSPASNSSATYKLIGADSIYFDGGSMFMGGVTTDITASGAKLSFEDNILYMTQYVNQTSTQIIYDMPVTTTINGKVVAKLQKQ
jgi:hypothetical protein